MSRQPRTLAAHGGSFDGRRPAKHRRRRRLAASELGAASGHATSVVLRRGSALMATMAPRASAVDVVRGFPGLRVLVIGDAMLDTWLEGEAIRLCKEAPVP